MENFNEINEKLAEIYPELIPINEMAELDDGIVVRNDGDDQKFSHFHWHGVHFNLFDRIPKNATELKRRIHFEKEQTKLSDNEIKKLLNVLQGKSQRKAGRFFPTVHDYTVSTWETLNKREVDPEY